MEDSHFLTVRFDGPAVSASRISVDQLILFLTGMNKALRRTNRVLHGYGHSVAKGRVPSTIEEEVALDFTQITHGSPAAVIGLERRTREPVLPGMGNQDGAFEKSLRGLAKIQEEDGDELPEGFDVGVLMAWRDTGKLLEQGVNRIEITLNHRAKPIRTIFSPRGLKRIRQRIAGPETNIRTIEGRLVMADFKEHGTRCRIHPAAGDPILCTFSDEQKEEVLEDILQYVRIVGEAQEDPFSKKIQSIRIHDIERLDNRDEDGLDVLPRGTPMGDSFWTSPELDDLARTQGVSTAHDIRALFGTWPGESDDGFEELIEDLRSSSANSGNAR